MTISTRIHEATNYRAWEQAWTEREALCLSEGGSPATLPQSLLRWLDGGSFLPPRELLGEIEAHIPRLYGEVDPRLALAESFASLWNRLHPFAPIERMHSRVAGAWTDLWLHVPTPVDGSTLDLAWLMLPLFRRYPRAFSLPEFEVVQPVFDPRPILSVVEEGSGIQSMEGGLLMGGMRLGETVNLESCLAESGLPIPPGWKGRGEACLLKADYYSPRRRRVTLQAGCAYGAPGFVFRVGFRQSRPQDWNPLSQIIRAVLDSGEAADTAPTSARTIMAPASGVQPADPSKASEATAVREPAPAYAVPHRFVYHHADDSISCDGRHMTKRVPARILRRLVMDFVRSGRREFEFRAFKRDSEIVTNRKRPNFEVRLRRVVEVIRDFPCGLILHRRRPGLLELEASTPIEYSEEA